MLQSELGPSDLAIFFLLSLLSVVPIVWPVFGLFSLPGIYVETYVYDDMYVRLPMTSYLRQNSHHVR